MIPLKYLDDIDPKSLTDEQRAQLNELYQSDPYGFYNLWRNPEQVQRWAEGDDFKTEPANDYFQKVGALRLAGAPEHVIDFWKEVLEHRNRPTEDTSAFPPATEPEPEKLRRIEELCEYLNGQLNWVEDNREPTEPEMESDFPDELPIAGRWQRLMKRAVGNIVTEHHDGTVTHFKSEDAVQANMGVEVVEVILEPEAKLDLDLEDWDNNYIKPEACTISGIGTKTKIRFEFYHCYT